MEQPIAGTSFLRALERAREDEWPFRHWVLHDLIDPDTLAGLKAWPHAAPTVRYALGRREENNETRRYVDAGAIEDYGPARALAEVFQDARVVSAIEARCGTSLAGTNLRIEYAQDTDGFWLEPHTDIGVKSFTMFVYLDDSKETAIGERISFPTIRRTRNGSRSSITRALSSYRATTPGTASYRERSTAYAGL